MTHDKYNQLTVIEKRDLIGGIIHLIQEDVYTFEQVQFLLERGQRIGYFDGVQFHPEPEDYGDNSQQT